MFLKSVRHLKKDSVSSAKINKSTQQYTFWCAGCLWLLSATEYFLYKDHKQQYLHIHLGQCHCGHKTQNINDKLMLPYESKLDAVFHSKICILLRSQISHTAFESLHCRTDQVCARIWNHICWVEVDKQWNLPLGSPWARALVLQTGHPSGHTSWVLGTLPKPCWSACSRNKFWAVPSGRKLLSPYRRVVFPAVVWVIPSDTMGSFFMYS